MSKKKKKKRTLPVGPHGEVKLPADVLEALGLQAGEQVEIHVDTRRKQVRLERHVEDAWAEAMREKSQKGLEDLMADQAQREEDANRIFEEKLKEPPPPRRPEDDPDLWR
ncbi:MAG: AbrB/MazE/SpoVT family DNA-binding domain-containing protein [Planctomycetota bacterium]|jgi:antitoxin component of MazEF toxin-antitoxin module